MIKEVKYLICCLVFFVLLSNRIYCQCYDAGNTYKTVVEIDKDNVLPYASKLATLIKLKQNAEWNHCTLDSCYIITLIKTAKYSYLIEKPNDVDFEQVVDTCISYSLQALRLSKLLKHPVSNNIIINAYFNLANYYKLILQQKKALALYDTVITLCKASDFEDYLAESRYLKAGMYSSLGDYQKSIDESTIGIQEALQHKDTSHYIALLNMRVDGLMHEDELAQAIRDITTAISIEKAMANNYWLAYSYEEKALILSKQDNFLEAEKLFLQAIKTIPDSSNYYLTIASDYNNLGNFYLFSLHNTKAAKQCYNQALNFGNKCDSKTKNLVSLMAYENMAEVKRAEHNLPQAVQLYVKACNQFNLQTKDFLFTNSTLNQLSLIEYRDLLFTLLSGKTQLLIDFYKQTGQPKYLEACLQTALLTDSLISRTLHEGLSESSILFWRNDAREFFNNVIEACYLLHDVNKAFFFMEKSRAALLNDNWNKLVADTHLPAKESERQEYLETKIIEQKQRLSSLPSNSFQYNREENNYLLTVDTLEHFITYLEKKYPAYQQYKYTDNVPELLEIQNYIDKNNQSFVHYYMNDSAIYALAVAKNKTVFVKVKAAYFNNSNLSEFMQLCSDKRALLNNYDGFSGLSKTIYTKIFQPLQINTENVAICTDNFFIPFEALCTDNKGKNFLLYNYNFSYVYSARSLMKPFSGGNATGNFAGFAPVSFASSLDVVSLPQSENVLQSVADFYNSNTVFTEHTATRRNFINDAPHYTVVTIFSHAQADTTDKEPVLYMCDSTIHLSELQLLKNPSIQFVLLSACQTNIGKNATGEGIYSLARGFASIGIPSVSATLWKADEKAIYQISMKFNEYLASGMNKSEALKKAKLWFLKKNNHSEQMLPYYWANMVLIGSSQPITLSSESHFRLWAGVIFLCVASVSLYCCLAINRKKRASV